MNRIYDATWKAFCSWCSRLCLDPTSVSVPQTLEFLQVGLDKGLSPDTIHHQAAALSLVLACRGLDSLAQHPTVCRFMAEFTNPSISYLFLCRLFLSCIAFIYCIASHLELIGDGRQCNLAIIYRDLKTSLKREVCGLGGESVVLTNGTPFPVPLLKVSHYQ